MPERSYRATSYQGISEWRSKSRRDQFEAEIRWILAVQHVECENELALAGGIDIVISMCFAESDRRAKAYTSALKYIITILFAVFSLSLSCSRCASCRFLAARTLKPY